MKMRLLLPILSLLLITACSPEPAETVTPPATPPASAEQALPSDTKADQSAIESAAQAEGESAGTDNAPTEQIVLESAEAETASADGERVWKYELGKHYQRFATAQGTSSAPDKIEVAEIFWYGCPHCFNFEPYLDKWKLGLAPDVSFVGIPVMWNPTNEIHARIFYTALALGKLDEMHGAIFSEIHTKNRMLTKEEEIQDLFSRYGVSAEDFNKTFRSFTVNGNLQRAKTLTQRYQVRSVPVLIINGKYTASGPETRNFDDMLAMVDELLEKERSEL
jgi:thiol:disulfide interchange protein DsbA